MDMDFYATGWVKNFKYTFPSHLVPHREELNGAWLPIKDISGGVMSILQFLPTIASGLVMSFWSSRRF